MRKPWSRIRAHARTQALALHPGGNPGANRWFLWSTPMQMLPLGGSISGRLTKDLPLGCLQEGEGERENNLSAFLRFPRSRPRAAIRMSVLNESVPGFTCVERSGYFRAARAPGAAFPGTRSGTGTKADSVGRYGSECRSLVRGVRVGRRFRARRSE